MKQVNAFVPRATLASGMAAQRGVSMLFALIALVVLTLGGVALVRSIDTGMLTLGNLGFRRSAVSEATIVTEKAVGWAYAQGPIILQNDGGDGSGYYATAVPNLAPLAILADATHPVSLIDWENNLCAGSSLDVTRRCLKPHRETLPSGTEIAYVITRLCSVPGLGGKDRPCIVPLKQPAATSMDRGSYSGLGRVIAGSDVTFYRIIARTKGARNSIGVTETLVHF